MPLWRGELFMILLSDAHTKGATNSIKADTPLCFPIINILTKTVSTTEIFVFIKATRFDLRGSSSG